MWLFRRATKEAKYETDKCVICMDEPSKDPTFLKCGHSFCENCITTYIAECKKKLEAKCPLCREKIYVVKTTSHWGNYFVSILAIAALIYCVEKGKFSFPFQFSQ